MALIELYWSGRQREAWTDVGGVGVGRRPRSETLRYFFSDPRFLRLQKITKRPGGGAGSASHRPKRELYVHTCIHMHVQGPQSTPYLGG